MPSPSTSRWKCARRILGAGAPADLGHGANRHDRAFAEAAIGRALSAGSSRLFGTDGIRAAFGQPPLERRVVEQVAYELVRGMAGRPTGPSSSPEATPARAPTRSPLGRLGRARCGRNAPLGGRDPDARCRLARPPGRRRRRSGGLREPQPVPGQRRQAPVGRGLQARGRSRARARSARRRLLPQGDGSARLGRRDVRREPAGGVRRAPGLPARRR